MIAEGQVSCEKKKLGVLLMRCVSSSFTGFPWTASHDVNDSPAGKPYQLAPMAVHLEKVLYNIQTRTATHKAGHWGTFSQHHAPP